MSTRLAPGPDLKGYRLMTMANALTLTKAMESGTSRVELARQLGVSRRTLYRWRAATFHSVVVEGWEATFVIRPSRAESNGPAYPVQITPWTEVES